MIDGKNFFDQPVKNDKITYENIRKIVTGQGGDDYSTDCLLDYAYFRDNYKIIAIGLTKQQALDADTRAIQQIRFTENLDRTGNIRIFFIFEERKKNCLRLFTGNCKSFVNVLLNNLVFINIERLNTAVEM